MKYFLILALFPLLFNPEFGAGQDNSILKVHFLYGSKPARGFKKQENKWFGGFHGGHVSIEIGGNVYGFGPTGRYHLIAHRQKKHSHYSRKRLSSWLSDTASNKYVTFILPIDSLQKTRMVDLLDSYVDETPYDYAFLGMRCAASTGHILALFDYLPKQSKFGHTFKYFYPKKLRRKMFKEAVKRDWQIVRVKGRGTRKWENDAKRFR